MAEGASHNDNTHEQTTEKGEAVKDSADHTTQPHHNERKK